MAIVVVALLVVRDKRLMKENPDPIMRTLFRPAKCLIAALLCALLGDRVGEDRQPPSGRCLPTGSASSQLACSFYPCMLTQYAKTRAFRLRLSNFTGHCADCLGDGIGGDWRGGKLWFPLPVADSVRSVGLPLPATRLLTFLTGGLEIVLVANSIINIAWHAVSTPDDVLSCTAGIATMAGFVRLWSPSVWRVITLAHPLQAPPEKVICDFLTTLFIAPPYEALAEDAAARRLLF